MECLQFSYTRTENILLIFNRIPGFTYLDLLHIYGISRAGYIPQLFIIRLPNPAVIFELISKTNAAALIYHDSFALNISNCLVPHFSVGSLPHSQSSKELGTLPPLQAPGPDSVMFIFHTSGSTSGTPKLVSCTGKWIDSMVRKSAVVAIPRAAAGRDVTVWM
jgi:acyl-CoA synthetase (AMP-forming)/AMP-acid ligase II